MSNLLHDIEAFLATHTELNAPLFGELAMNDRHLVRQMRGVGDNRPRRLWPETEAKVRHFMATYRPSANRDAA